MVSKEFNFKNAISSLKKLENKEKAKVYKWFFKTGKGEYGEGDKFLGLSSSQIQNISEKFKDLSLGEVLRLLKGKYHEERMLGVRILVNKFKKSDELCKKEIAEFYLKNSKFINNWDLVDVSAYKILGPYAELAGNNFLFDLSGSKLIWERRMSIVATFHFIKKGQSDLTLRIARQLLGDGEDLMHKAVGWMLREVGKRCGENIEEVFLKKHYKIMPRTMLRYAIERFKEDKRKRYLLGQI